MMLCCRKTIRKKILLQVKWMLTHFFVHPRWLSRCVILGFCIYRLDPGFILSLQSPQGSKLVGSSLYSCPSPLSLSFGSIPNQSLALNLFTAPRSLTLAQSVSGGIYFDDTASVESVIMEDPLLHNFVENEADLGTPYEPMPSRNDSPSISPILMRARCRAHSCPVQATGIVPLEMNIVRASSCPPSLLCLSQSRNEGEKMEADTDNQVDTNISIASAQPLQLDQDYGSSSLSSGLLSLPGLSSRITISEFDIMSQWCQLPSVNYRKRVREDEDEEEEKEEGTAKRRKDRFGRKLRKLVRSRPSLKIIIPARKVVDCDPMKDSVEVTHGRKQEEDPDRVVRRSQRLTGKERPKYTQPFPRAKTRFPSKKSKTDPYETLEETIPLFDALEEPEVRTLLLDRVIN